MRRFYFTIRGKGYDAPDDTGLELADADAAISHAKLLAARLAEDESYDPRAIIVTDDKNQRISVIPILAVDRSTKH